MKKTLSLLIFCAALVLIHSSHAFGVVGKVCNGKPTGWCFFSCNCAYPHGPKGCGDINCNLKGDKCCQGTITDADSSKWIPAGCQDWSGLCTGACTPTGRLVINYGNCQPVGPTYAEVMRVQISGGVVRISGTTTKPSAPYVGIRKGSTTYYVPLVGTIHSTASKVLVRTNNTTYALRKCGGTGSACT